MRLLVASLLVLGQAAFAQTVCPATRVYTPCDLTFDIPGADPQKPVDLSGEFRSPKAVTVLAHAFWDSGAKWVIRFTPTEAGTYAYRITGSLAPFAGKEGQVTATAAENPGWLRAANLHHFAYVSGITLTPHLYMGAIVTGFDSMDLTAWKSLVDTRAAQHFNHMAVTLISSASADSFRKPEFFRAAEEKIAYANQHGIIVDVAFFAAPSFSSSSGANHFSGADLLLTRLMPNPADRRAWYTYALSRLAPYDVVWDGLENWESYPNGRALEKEIGDALAKFDPYQHTRTTRTALSTGPLVDDGWLRIRSYQTADDSVSAVEQQIYQYPAINNFSADEVNAEKFRHRLWNSTMDGQYPQTRVPDEQAANAMKTWYEFLQTTRYWELEPFFDVDGGRGLQLEGIEYVIYVEKPGPVTATVEQHGYDVEWIDPATGEHSKVKDACKKDICTATPPANTHDWILHISRESTKAGMLKSVKYDSRDEDLKLQDIEGDPAKLPFDIIAPESDTISLSHPPAFGIKMKRQSKALQDMKWVWMGEVTASGRGSRIIGDAASGTFQIPPNIAESYPAALHVKLYGMNGLGKVYMLDRNYTLTN